MSTNPLSLQDAVAKLTARGEMFEMEMATVRGIEMSTWKHAPRDLRQVFDMSLAHATNDFLVYEDRRITFEQHYRAASTLSQRFHAMGLAKGERVGIAARNSPEWVIAFWAAVVSGAIVVPLNAWWTTSELVYGLQDSSAAILFVDEERLERLRDYLDDLPSLHTIVVVSDDYSRPTRLGKSDARVRIVAYDEFLGDVEASATPPPLAFEPDDEVTMFYTSGTTGHPKGALGTHRNSATNIMNLFYRGQITALRTNDEAKLAEPTQSATLLSVPLFHATGCLAVMMSSTVAGAKIVMMHHFDARRALKLIESERITSFGGVPTVAMQILDHPDFAQFDTSSVTSVTYGGAPAPPELVKRIRAAFPVGQPGNGYGLTETSAGVCFNAGPDYVARPESCGPVVPVCEVAVVPEDFTGDEPTSTLPRGPEVVGELWVKGPNVVVGYWNKPEETNAVFTKGWLHTGDVARIDDEGFVYIVDRAKDMIIRGGENVYSVIVEAAIFEHPDVADCAVVGVAHPSWGEEVAAVIVLRPGRVVEAEEIMRHVGARLARFEVPTKIVFRSMALPRNPQGKVLKRELRASLLELDSTTNH